MPKGLNNLRNYETLPRRLCERCGRPFRSPYSSQRFCCPAHARAAARGRPYKPFYEPFYEPYEPKEPNHDK